MSTAPGTHRSRRRRGVIGAVAIAAGATVASLLPAPALADDPWPHGQLGQRDAIRVKERQFMPLHQFRMWHEELDQLGPAKQRGLRATGTKAHEHYVARLADRLRTAGVKGVRLEGTRLRRWTASRWSLSLLDGPFSGKLRTASYIPYSGKTGPHGVRGPLAYVPHGTTPAPGSLDGKIAVFDVVMPPLTLGVFTVLEYVGTRFDPDGEITPSTPYVRPYLREAIPLSDLEAAGATGAVGIIDFPFAAAKGSYFPYDGIIEHVPGLYVDRATGVRLKQQAQAGTRARLTLPARVRTVTTHNVVGFIPGRSKQLVTLNSHTDGSNALEDNGPDAIVAMSQYLARLPRKALPRTVMVLLTSGHFAGGVGARAFRKRHADTLVRRTKAAVTIEHLGTKEWLEVSPGRMALTGRFEPGAVFTPDAPGLVAASARALRRGKAAPASVLRPMNPNGNGTTVPVWPGEGQYLYARGGMPTANYITGPTYLLNWGVRTTDKVSFRRVRREAIGFTEMVLRLGRTPGARLRTSPN